MNSLNNGLILINKPKDITSRDVVNKISKIYGTKKVGHSGTLDPLATGVLVITLNRYTKLNEILASKEKEYIAEVTLGIKTDTLDITGKILEEKEEKIDKESLLKVLKSFEKTYDQKVPLYSAVKIDGKKLYEYARKGEKVDVPTKTVTIKKIELLEFKENKFTFKALATKGTYIRSLINDILKELNVIGTMSNLQRTKQGIFKIEDCLNLEEITKDTKLLKIKDVLDISSMQTNEKEKILNGAKLTGNYPNKVLFLDGNEELAIYKKDGNVMKIEVLLKIK